MSQNLNLKIPQFPLKRIDEKNQYENKGYSFQVLDIEAIKWSIFQVGAIFDGINYHEFLSMKSMVEFILNSKTALNIFAHFGGGYDFLFLIDECLRQGIKIDKVVPRGSMLLSFRLHGKYKKHSFKDSCALLPFSLEKLTHSFNVETKKGKYDHSLNRPLNDEMRAYLKSDCTGLYQVLDAYFKSDLVRRSGPATTIAGQAQKIFRCYLDQDINRPTESQNEFMREACHGGRTEIFKPLGEKIFCYDVNSLYPTVMSQNAYPAGKLHKTYQYKENKFGIYKCKITTPKNLTIPIIPYKAEKKLLFPLGTFTSTVTSIEIEYAKTLGYKFEIKEGIYFSDKKEYFKEFIEDLYSIREKSERDTVDNILTKLVMNSAYGRFLIKPLKQNILFDKPDDKAVSDLFKKYPKKTAELLVPKHTKDVVIDGKKYEIWEEPKVINSYINCGIGAFILAYARIHMHKIMHPIAEHVYYTDTDSIWTDKILPTGKGLGALKLERPEEGDLDYYENVCFLLPKTYLAENKFYKKVAMKGFDNKKIQHFTYNEFKNALQGEINLKTGVLKVKHSGGLSRMKSAMKKNKILLNKPDFYKSIKSKYNKRKLNLTLNKSVALTLNN